MWLSEGNEKKSNPISQLKSLQKVMGCWECCTWNIGMFLFLATLLMDMNPSWVTWNPGLLRRVARAISSRELTRSLKYEKTSFWTWTRDAEDFGLPLFEAFDANSSQDMHLVSRSGSSEPLNRVTCTSCTACSKMQRINSTSCGLGKPNRHMFLSSLNNEIRPLSPNVSFARWQMLKISVTLDACRNSS